jgi:hypothetical protein
MIQVHLYGKLRRFSGNQDTTSASIAAVEWRDGDTVGRIVDRLGIPIDQLGSNIFLNGTYATLESSVQDEDRLGLFPDDMQLLYKWYFAPKQTSAAPSPSSGDPKSDKEPQK